MALFRYTVYNHIEGKFLPCTHDVFSPMTSSIICIC